MLAPFHSLFLLDTSYTPVVDADTFLFWICELRDSGTDPKAISISVIDLPVSAAILIAALAMPSVCNKFKKCPDAADEIPRFWIMFNGPVSVCRIISCKIFPVADPSISLNAPLNDDTAEVNSEENWVKFLVTRSETWPVNCLGTTLVRMVFNCWFDGVATVLIADFMPSAVALANTKSKKALSTVAPVIASSCVLEPLTSFTTWLCRPVRFLVSKPIAYAEFIVVFNDWTPLMFSLRVIPRLEEFRACTDVAIVIACDASLSFSSLN